MFNRVLLCGLILSLVFLAGCTAQEPQKETLLDEYQRSIDSIGNDAQALGKILDKWNILIEQYNKGGIVDLNDLIESGRDYVDQSNIIKPKIENLKTFINNNEAELKNLGIDTFKEKQDLDELKVKIENNVRNLERNISELKA